MTERCERNEAHYVSSPCPACIRRRDPSERATCRICGGRGRIYVTPNGPTPVHIVQHRVEGVPEPGPIDRYNGTERK
jgi:hypothetical protein